MNDDGYIVGLQDFRKLLESIPNTIRNKLLISPNVRLRSTATIGFNIRYGVVPADVASKDYNLYCCGQFIPKNQKDQDKLYKWQEETPICQDDDGNYYYLEIEVDAYPNLITYDGVVYSRSGSTLQIMEARDLEKAIFKSSGKTWDSFAVSAKKMRTVSDLDHSAIDFLRNRAVDKGRLTAEAAAKSDQTLLHNLGLLTVDDELTRAAVMLFSDPTPIVAGAFVKIGYFAPVGSRGMNTENDVIYNDSVAGPLISQADRAVDILYSKYLKALISYEGLQRVETYMIPQEALREIICNAIAHKLYQSGNPIQIRVYDDHIRITNEGNWPFDKIKVEEVYSKDHDSYPSNPLIAKGLHTAGEIETWEKGLKKSKLLVKE